MPDLTWEDDEFAPPLLALVAGVEPVSDRQEALSIFGEPAKNRG